MSTTRSCDSCKSAKAVLYCLADLGFLCMNCDSKIHTTRQHERVWLCDLCEEAPASVTCKADAAMLCVTCDRNIHSANPLAVRHERVPVVPFLEAQPASSWMIPSFNLPNFFEEKKEKEKEKSEGDYVYSDMDPYFDLDNVPPMEQSFHTQQKKVFGSDGVVPVHTTPSPPAPIVSSPSPFYIDFGGSKPEPPYTFSVQSAQSLYSVSSSSDLVVPDRIDIAIGNGAVAVTSVEATPLSGLEREARVLRYREKRKNRKFEKTIRYASRKAYAETRPRIKGRFVKRTEREMGMEREVEVVDGMYSSAFAFMAHSVGYGVVPTF